MSSEIVGDSFDQIYFELMQQLMCEPEFVCSPRGKKINEVIATTLVLTNPRNRLLTAKARQCNYGFAVGEFLWYWQGKSDLATMLYYNKRMKDFSDDGISLNSAYGYRLKGSERALYCKAIGKYETRSQWQTCIETLLEDPDSRRAVMLINDRDDEQEAITNGSKDVPCTLSLQLFIRDSKLFLHTHMRSNDAVWGLTYDLFSFTLFQEMMLLELRQHEQFKDLELGSYFHTAGSLHIYDTHYKMAEDIIAEYKERLAMADMSLAKPMAPVGSLRGMEALCRAEEAIRIPQDGPTPGWELEDWNGTCMQWMVKQLLDHRNKRDAEAK